MPAATINQLIEYVWIPIVLSVVGLWRRLSGADTRVQLLEQHQQHFEQQRSEERELRDTQRSETHLQIQTHHDTVMTKLDSLELRIKNGHG